MPTTDIPIDDAINILAIAKESDPADVEIERVLGAAAVIQQELNRRADDLDRMRSIAHSIGRQANIPVGEGHELVLEWDAGGRRYFLNGRPVHAGDSLFILTFRGWMSGRYEWTYDDSPPLFYWALPGVNDLLVFRLPAKARLAWPDEIGERT